jgi:hypothetical protein
METYRGHPEANLSAAKRSLYGEEGPGGVGSIGTIGDLADRLSGLEY